MKPFINQTGRLIATILLLFQISTFFLYSQRPGIECGCEKHGDYKKPASKGILLEQGATVQEGSSQEGKYLVEALDAIPPNTVTLIIRSNGRRIFQQTNSAVGWGFSPDEDRFVVHGYDATGKHWCTLVNLDPDAGSEGENATYSMILPPTQIVSSRIRFSPHGCYLLYSGITANGNLFLRIFNTQDFELVYDGSTASPIVGLADGSSIAGWGFSPDEQDATFIHAFQTDASKYTMCVKKLTAPPGEFIVKTNSIEGGSCWRFSPCGDIFLWIFEDLQSNPVCRYYTTNGENPVPIETATAINFVKAFSEEDGHYIEYVDGNEKVFDNTADHPCDDDQKPSWTEATLDTSNVTGFSLVLKWSGASDNNGVTHYRIYMNDSLVKALPATDHAEIKDLPSDSTLEFAVQAGDAAGNWSTDGPTGWFNTKKDLAPEWPAEPPALLTANPIEGTRVQLHWQNAMDDWGVELYRIFCNDSLVHKTSGDTTSCMVAGLLPEQADTLMVQAGDGSNQWSTDNPVLVVTLQPDAPPYWLPDDQLTASDITETSMLLKWHRARDDFRVRTYDVLQDGKKITTCKYDTSYSVKDLEEGTLYKFSVIAYDDFPENVSEPLEADLRTLAAFVEDSLITQAGDQTDPDIDFNTVVWKDERTSQSDIYTYDLETDQETQYTDDETYQGFPRVQGKRVVWMDNRTGNGDIYLYDPEMDTVVICPGPELQTVPDIYGDHVVWAQLKSGEPDNWNIVMYDLETKEKIVICDAPGKQTNPAISEKWVVWEDWRNGNADIYGHHINSSNNLNEYEICIESSKQMNPTVAEESGWSPGCYRGPGRTLYYPGFPYYFVSVCWQDDRNQDWDIYYCEISGFDMIPCIGSPVTDRKIYYNRSNQVNPHCNHNTLVFQDDRNGNWDIYACQKEAGTWYSPVELEPICIAAGDQINPRTWGGRIAWEDYRHGDADIYIWDRPPGSDLQLKVSESKDPVGVKKMLEYTLIARNDGFDRNENVTVTCSFPLEAKYEEHHVTKGTTNLEGNSLQWHIPELRYDSIAVLTCRFLTYDLATLTFSAEVKGDAFDPDPSNNKILETTNVRFVIPAIIGEGRDPDLKAGENGNVHLAYFSPDSLIYAQKECMEEWYAENLAAVGTYVGQSCALALDQQQNVHICYSTYDWSEYPPARLHHLWKDEQQQWHNTIVAISDSGYADLQMGINSQDEINLVFRAAENNIFYAPMKFMKTFNGEWTEPCMIEKDGYNDIDLVLDETGRPHVSYYAINKGIMYRYSPDPNTNLWSAAEMIEPDWGGGQLEGLETSISLDDSGLPHISYVGNIDHDYRENIKHAWKKDGIWNIEKVDNGDFGSSGNGVFAEGMKKTHFLYAHFLSDEIRYATKSRGLWIKQVIDQEENHWFNSALIDQDANHHNHLVYEKNGVIYYALRRPVPVLEIHPDTLDFGSVPVDSSSRITVFLENTEHSVITVDSAVIMNDDCFQVEKAFTRLGRDETEGMYVYFTPHTKGVYNTSLRIYYNAPSGLYMDIPVLARSSMPLLRVQPAPVDFGIVPVNTQEIIAVDIINEGEQELVFSEINVKKEFYGTVYPTDFSLLSANCDALPGGDSCEAVIRFEPQSPGAQYSYLNINSNDPMEPEKQIRIIGRTPVSRLTVSSTVIDLGYASINSTVNKDIELRNTGEVDIEIYTMLVMQDPDADQFQLDHNCTVIPPGESCIVTVYFRPTRQGDMEIKMSIGSNAGSQNFQTITIRGSTIERNLNIEDHLVDFGTVMTGADSTRIITLENNGTSEIIINEIELSGPDRLEFFKSSECSTLIESEHCNITLTFKPVFDGIKHACLVVHSNDSDHPEDTIALTGTAAGIEPPLSVHIDASKTAGQVPLEVGFSSGVTGGASPYTYHWDFDDATSSAEAHPLHLFDIPGTYMVTCRVTDSEMETATDSLEILVYPDSLPDVIIYGSPLSGEAPLEVTFTAEILGGNAPVDIAWNFGDGGSSSLIDPIHIFEAAGNYRVTAIVTDADSDTGSDTLFIDVLLKKYLLSGTAYVEDSSMVIDDGIAELYEEMEPNPFEAIGLTGEGVFAFDDLAAGIYTVKVIPDTIGFPEYLPTYSGNSLTLFNAIPVNMEEDITEQDIFCRKQPDEGAGAGEIGGKVLGTEGSGNLKLVMEGMHQEDVQPLAGTMVYLFVHETTLLKGADRTGSQGGYLFSSLDDGMYNLVVDYQGIPMSDENTPLEIGPEARTLVVDALVSANEITTEHRTDIDNHAVAVKGLSIYPNPAKDILFIAPADGFALQEKTRIELFNSTGQKLIDTRYRRLAETGIELDVSALAAGSYHLRITCSDWTHNEVVMVGNW